MTLKKRQFFKKNKNSQFKRKIPGGDFIRGGVNALLGVSLLGVTAQAVGKI